MFFADNEIENRPPSEERDRDLSEELLGEGKEILEYDYFVCFFYREYILL